MSSRRACVEPAFVIFPEPALRDGGVLAGHDPEVGGELVEMIEALPLADLGTEPERGERVDPA